MCAPIVIGALTGSGDGKEMLLEIITGTVSGVIVLGVGAFFARMSTRSRQA